MIVTMLTFVTDGEKVLPAVFVWQTFITIGIMLLIHWRMRDRQLHDVIGRLPALLIAILLMGGWPTTPTQWPGQRISMVIEPYLAFYRVEFSLFTVINRQALPVREGVHWQDHEELQAYWLPEWSHLSGSEADRYTQALYHVIQRERAKNP